MLKEILRRLKALWDRLNKAVEPDPPEEGKEIMPSDGSGYEEVDKDYPKDQ